MVCMDQRTLRSYSKFHGAGPCTRCEMVCMDQQTGLKVGPEPLLTLASFRRINGRILFGILLTHQPSAHPLQAGTMAVQPETDAESSCHRDQMGHEDCKNGRGGKKLCKAAHADPPNKQAGEGSLPCSLFPVLRVGTPLFVDVRPPA